MSRPPGSTGRPRRKPAPPPTAYGTALRWLTIRERTESELRLKLKRKGFEPSEIDAAIERVRNLGYLDDVRFARGRAQALLGRGKLGPRGVAARLAAAGVTREQAKEAVQEAMSERDELELARAALKKKRVDRDDPKSRARAARFLLARGFSSDVVRRAVNVELEGDLE